MSLLHRLSLRTTLLLGVVLAAVLAAGLLAGVHHILRESAGRMESSLQEEIQPLVQISRLQARLDELRLAEVELAQLTDVFAVTSQIEVLRADTNALAAEVAGVSSSVSLPPSVGEAWTRYAEDLRRMAQEERKRRPRPIEFPLAGCRYGMKRRAVGSLSGTTRRGPYEPMACWSQHWA